MGNHARSIFTKFIVAGIILLAIRYSIQLPSWLYDVFEVIFICYVLYMIFFTSRPNYAFRFVLPEQKATKHQEEDPGQDDKAIAISSLQQQLRFQRQQPIQIYDSEFVSIKTERSGQNLKISWNLSPDLPLDYTLIGFRKTGSFSMNQCDLANNGTLVVETNDEGELMEFLQGGETYFYTFLLRNSSWLGGLKYTPVSRFQVPIRTDVEAEIEKLILRLEESSEEKNAKLVAETKPTKPPNKQLVGALTDLGSFVEFEEVFDATLKTLIARIEQGNYSEEEKQDKIARLRDMGSILREQYQQ